MMCGRSIRPMSAEERDKRDEQNKERYDMVFAQIEAEERAEYEAEFGETFRRKFPFKANGQAIHEKTVKRITEQYA